ncbi:DUF6530 family protein, partial [Escherichia coli]
TLICIAMDYSKHGRLSSSDDFPVSRSGGNPELSRHIDLMKNELKENHEYLDESLKRLAAELKRLGY